MQRVLLLTIWLAFQAGAPTPPPPGRVSGVLKNANGRPASGIRISAMAKPDSPQDLVGGALVSIAQTDAEGRYKLEEVPPGAYYIIAGRVDVPTYYPGTAELAGGKMVEVAPGATVTDIDFAMNAGSVRTEFTDLYRAAMEWKSVPLRLISADDGKLPFTSASGAVTVQFERQADGAITNVPVTNTAVNLQYVVASPVTDYKVNIANLPEGFAVASITQDGNMLVGGVLKLQASGAMAPVVFTVAKTAPPEKPTTGVRITGRSRPGDTHPVFLSGRQGVTFTDGTFEFRNVPPGRHTLASIDAPGRSMGLTLVVGDRDLDVALGDVAVLPADIQTPREPEAAGAFPAGATVAPVTLHGRVREETTKEPPPAGQIYISGRYGPSYALDAEGRFEIPKLLPGTYNLEAVIFGFSNVTQRIIVGTEDISVELAPRKLY